MSELLLQSQPVGHVFSQHLETGYLSPRIPDGAPAQARRHELPIFPFPDSVETTDVVVPVQFFQYGQSLIGIVKDVECRTLLKKFSNRVVSQHCTEGGIRVDEVSGRSTAEYPEDCILKQGPVPFFGLSALFLGTFPYGNVMNHANGQHSRACLSRAEAHLNGELFTVLAAADQIQSEPRQSRARRMVEIIAMMLMMFAVAFRHEGLKGLPDQILWLIPKHRFRSGIYQDDPACNVCDNDGFRKNRGCLDELLQA
jgi:hypothetical protein